MSDERWHVIVCPSRVRFSSVDKEPGTHGFIYTLWEAEEQLPVWVSQSIPALVRCINAKAVAIREKRLHASSVYRVLRGESLKKMHKSYRCARWSRDDIERLNEHLRAFSGCIVVSKAPERWNIEAP